MNRLVEEYIRSLKMREAEEVLDIFLYRPLAFVLVKGVYRSPITPNQISFLSMIAGLLAGWCFSASVPAWWVWGGFWFAIANVLDCGDGQLARLQQSGTMFGRLVDGLVDYVISLAVFIGIGIGLEAAGTEQWPLVIAAGLSSALHAIVFDRYQGLYISSARGETGYLASETEKFQGEELRLRELGGARFRRFLIGLYLQYLEVQRAVEAESPEGRLDTEMYHEANHGMIRFWTLLGPTTNRSLLIICAFAGNPSAFLWIVTIAGNLILATCLIGQRRITSRLASRR